jgi:hypothetical protein
MLSLIKSTELILKTPVDLTVHIPKLGLAENSINCVWKNGECIPEEIDQ